MNWRELAKLKKWREISSWRVPAEDLPELYELLSEVVPTGTKGDGVECPSPLELGHYIGGERGIGHGEEATFRRRHLEAAA